MMCFIEQSKMFSLLLLHVCMSMQWLLRSDDQLQNIDPVYYQEISDVVISSSKSWELLSDPACCSATGDILLVKLMSICEVPTEEQLPRIKTPFILVGPFYEWHHVNFGPLSELDAPSGADIFESRLSNKLEKCTSKITVADIRALQNHPALQWWIVHQHVRSDVRHEKLRILPLGFGYRDYRMSGPSLDQWKQLAASVLEQKKTTDQPHLLLTSFTVHTTLFGNSGTDVRSQLLKRLHAEETLLPYAPLTSYENPRDFMIAVANSKFVLSPWGWGPDCFRHYEAIALGSIPIVLSDWSTDRALEGLPALIVGDWSELNETMLLQAYRQIKAQKYEIARLTKAYWTRTLFRVRSKFQKVCFHS
jgi:hypothetical protein